MDYLGAPEEAIALLPARLARPVRRPASRPRGRRHVGARGGRFAGLGLRPEADTFPGLGRRRRWHRPEPPDGHGRTATPRCRGCSSAAGPGDLPERAGAARTRRTSSRRAAATRSSTARAHRADPAQLPGRPASRRLTVSRRRWRRSSTRTTAAARASASRAKHVSWRAGTASPPSVLGPAETAGRRPLLRPQGAADLRPRGLTQLAGLRRRRDQQRHPARQQPVLGQHQPHGGRSLRQRLRSDAEHRRTSPPCSTSRSYPAARRRRRSSRRTSRGREKLLEQSFEDLEGALVDVLDRSVNRPAATSTPRATSTPSWSTAGTTATPTS